MIWSCWSSWLQYFDGSFTTFGKTSKHPGMVCTCINDVTTVHFCLHLRSTLLHSVVLFWIIAILRTHSPFFLIFHLLGQPSLSRTHLRPSPPREPQDHHIIHLQGCHSLECSVNNAPRVVQRVLIWVPREPCVSLSSHCNMTTYSLVGSSQQNSSWKRQHRPEKCFKTWSLDESKLRFNYLLTYLIAVQT